MLLKKANIFRFIYMLPLFFVHLGKAQHYDIGLFVGTSYYLGELNPGEHFTNKPQPVGGVFVRKNLNKRYALRFSGNYGKLSATDALNNSALSNFRNIRFSGSITEIGGQLELNFLPYQINNATTSRFSPFVFIGMAGFLSNAETTNVADDSFSSNSTTIAVSIPFGVGMKFNFVRNIGMSLEWNMRKTFTDRIDGLAETYSNGYQLSNSKNNDWYSFFGITFNYKILTKYDRCPVVNSPY